VSSIFDTNRSGYRGSAGTRGQLVQQICDFQVSKTTPSMLEVFIAQALLALVSKRSQPPEPIQNLHHLRRRRRPSNLHHRARILGQQQVLFVS
jgi:hypothetical protein